MDKGRVGDESKGKETDGCPLTSPPPSKARRHDVRGSPGGSQICSGKRDRVEDGHINMVGCARVFVVELRYL
jgi:hypothetical protein